MQLLLAVALAACADAEGTRRSGQDDPPPRGLCDNGRPSLLPSASEKPLPGDLHDPRSGGIVVYKPIEDVVLTPMPSASASPSLPTPPQTPSPATPEPTPPQTPSPATPEPTPPQTPPPATPEPTPPLTPELGPQDCVGFTTVNTSDLELVTNAQCDTPPLYGPCHLPELDSDCDGVTDASDNCPCDPNGLLLQPEEVIRYCHDRITGEPQVSLPGGVGTRCEVRASDGTLVSRLNLIQSDLDNDELGDPCDDDDDGDDVTDERDICPASPDWPRLQQRRVCGTRRSIDEALAYCEATDLGWAVYVNPDVDPDGDRDGDGVADGRDNCPRLANPNQEDLDKDGRGKRCDPDDDGDGVADSEDNCPEVPNYTQADEDGDLVGDACQ